MKGTGRQALNVGDQPRLLTRAAGVISFCVIISVVLEQQYLFEFGSLFSVLQYQVYLLDLLSLAAFFVFMASGPLRTCKRVSRLACLSVAVLIGVTAVGVLSWILTLGIETAVVYWRPWLWALPLMTMAAAYATRKSWFQLRAQVVSVAAAAAAILIAFRFAQVLGLSSGTLGCSASLNSLWYCNRVLAPGGVLLLVLGVPVVAGLRMPNTVRISLIGLLTVAVGLSEVRSAWLAFTAVLVVWLWVTMRSPSLHSQRKLGIVVLFVFLVTLFAGFQLQGPISNSDSINSNQTTTDVDFAENQGAQASDSEDLNSPSAPGLNAYVDSGTLEWRLALWKSLLEGMVVDPRSIVIGSLNGASPEWDNPNAQPSTFRTSAHNEILYDLTTVGLAGAVAVAVLWLSAWSNRSVLLGFTAVWLWGLLAFSLFNSLPTWTWLIFGVGLVRGSSPSFSLRDYV
jgi:hypothetical protein